MNAEEWLELLKLPYEAVPEGRFRCRVFSTFVRQASDGLRGLPATVSLGAGPF
jgi:hypothetical protein